MSVISFCYLTSAVSGYGKGAPARLNGELVQRSYIVARNTNYACAESLELRYGLCEIVCIDGAPSCECGWIKIYNYT